MDIRLVVDPFGWGGVFTIGVVRNGMPFHSSGAARGRPRVSVYACPLGGAWEVDAWEVVFDEVYDTDDGCFDEELALTGS